MEKKLDLTNLRKIAEAVKQEPWVLAGGNEWISPIGITVDYDNGGVSSIEAEFIATFDPPTVLALIRQLEAVRGLREGQVCGHCHDEIQDALDWA